MNLIKNKKTECIVLLIYLVGLIVISAFHESWFDEAQAWEIARCASLKEIFTVVPHYEGHPPLWHLILVPFAKSGMPFAISVHAINILFSTSAMGILIFKSPFPKPVRLLLPFTYFFFYQYGVLARPYSIMMLAVMLSAMTYTERNQKPFRYIFSLCLLCLTSAYGIMIAGGLCIVWTIEILTEMKKNKTLKIFWKDRRFYALCLILLLAVWLFFTILPADNCWYRGCDDDTTLLTNFLNWRLWIMWIIYPFDVWFGNYLNYLDWSISDLSLIMELFGGLLFWLLWIPILQKNHKFWTFFLSYTFFSMFMIFNYSSSHHTGIFIMFHVFTLWIIYNEPKGMQIPEEFQIIFKKIEKPFIQKTIYVAGIIICMIPIFTAIGASGLEITHNYCPVYFAEFIKKNHLEDTKIMLSWEMEGKKDDNEDEEDIIRYPMHYMPSPHPEIEKHYTYIMGHGSTLSVYFDRNIFMNFNVDCPEDLYVHYQYLEDVDAVFASWREKGLPDFIFEYIPIDEIYGEDMLEGVEYVCIEEFKSGLIFKAQQQDAVHRIFIRKDLLNEYPQFHQMYP